MCNMRKLTRVVRAAIDNSHANGAPGMVNVYPFGGPEVLQVARQLGFGVYGYQQDGKFHVVGNGFKLTMEGKVKSW